MTEKPSNRPNKDSDGRVEGGSSGESAPPLAERFNNRKGMVVAPDNPGPQNIVNEVTPLPRPTDSGDSGSGE